MADAVPEFTADIGDNPDVAAAKNRERRKRWLIRLAMEMGLRGATLIAGSESFGRDRRIHSARFFELADQPQEILMTATAEETQTLFDRLKSEGVHLFYVKTPVEFGSLGEPGQ